MGLDSILGRGFREIDCIPVLVMQLYESNAGTPIHEQDLASIGIQISVATYFVTLMNWNNDSKEYCSYGVQNQRFLRRLTGIRFSSTPLT